MSHDLLKHRRKTFSKLLNDIARMKKGKKEKKENHLPALLTYASFRPFPKSIENIFKGIRTALIFIIPLTNTRPSVVRTPHTNPFLSLSCLPPAVSDSLVFSSASPNSSNSWRSLVSSKGWREAVRLRMALGCSLSIMFLHRDGKVQK